MTSATTFYFSSTDVDSVVEEIVKREPLITLAKVEKVKELIASNSIGSISSLPLHRLPVVGLQEKIAHPDDRRFYLFKVLRAHILPLTYVSFNKAGSMYV